MQLTHLGPYEIEKPLGKGGMGSVFAARVADTGQRVAIKALSPHLAMAEGFRERFEAEIESLKTLRHEGIVRLYGYGEQDGVLFYSMELVEGISLEDELKAGRRFNWREVTNIAIQLSLALKHAHDHGIVHRDIKPANILLYVVAGGSPADGQADRLSLPEERVKLADFGIARLFGMTQLTTAGGVLGTADYMSPEQAEGRPVTARCDQYSLGGVMYALLAGRPPFLAKNLPQMLQLQRFAEPEPVRRYAPDTPEQLERIIEQLLAKDPADRYPNTQVLARHLQALVRALSRPIADDFPPPADDDAAHGCEASIDLSPSDNATQLDAGVSEPQFHGPFISAVPTNRKMTVDEVATVAAEELTPIRQPTTNRAPDPTVPPVEAPVPPAAERPTRFTTIEEEESRLHAEYRRPWLVVGAQLGALAMVLAGIVAATIYLSRPPSADELYQSITADIERDDDASLSTVASEMHEFLKRFPNDKRATELEQYKERVELDRLHRKLHRQARERGAIDPELLPLEQLYLRAMKLAESSPDEAIARLQALADLYRPGGSNGKDDQASMIARLAGRQLTVLREQVAAQRASQLALLKERLVAAEQLAPTDPRQATAMYRAIIELHAADAWADGIVAQARTRLAELESKQE
jgi:serine/threonine-protein kinase